MTQEAQALGESRDIRDKPCLRSLAGFAFRGKENAVWYSMSSRSTGLAGVICLMVVGCAANPSAPQSDNRLWDVQKARQQQAAREAGRIGHIGNEGPASSR
jgi:hypothetical protein